MKRSSCSIISALTVALSCYAHAVDTSSEPSCPQIGAMRVGARHIDPNGIGYHEGYTTIEGFFPYSGWDKGVFFLDTRMHVFNNGRPALNAGVGGRYLHNGRIWGMNTYYDYRKTHHYHYNQIGVGIESLGKLLDFRLNGYIPLGTKRSHYYDTEFYKFKGHNAIFRQKYEYALGGINGEVGAHVDAVKHFPLYFAAGPYYLHGQGGAAWGGQARAAVTIYDYLTVEVNGSYDSLYKWIGQGQVGLNFSFGPQKKIGRIPNSQTSCASYSIVERAYQPVERFEIIPVDKKNRYSPAINPLTGEPYFFWFINNLSHCNGSIESPCNTLDSVASASDPVDVIYVFRGDGTTTGMDMGITLQDNQRLWGATTSQYLPTSWGMMNIPAQDSGTRPILSNSAGNVVTLGNNNEISGLFLQNTNSTYGIYANGVNNVTLSSLYIAGSNQQGQYGFYGNELTGLLTISDSSLLQDNSIYLANTTGALTTSVIRSRLAGGLNSDSFVWDLSNDAKGVLNFSNNTVQNTGSGINIGLSDTSAFNGVIAHNTLTVGFNEAIYLNGQDDTVITVLIDDNQVTTEATAIVFNQGAQLTASLTNNYILSDSRVFIVNALSGTGALTVSDNTLHASNQETVFIDHQDGTFSASFSNNTLSSVDSYAFDLSMSNTADSFTLNMDNNTLTGLEGVVITQQAGIFSGTLSNNTIATSDASIDTNLTGTGLKQTLLLTDNEIAGSRGVNSVADTGELLLTLRNNEIQGLNNDAMRWDMNTAVTQSEILLENNQFFNSIDGSHTSGSAVLTMEGNTFNDEISLDLDGVLTDMDMTLSNNIGTSTTAHFFTIIHNAGELTSSMTNNTFTSADGRVLQYSSANPVNSTQTFSDNSFTTTSNSSAVYFDLSSTGDSTITLDNNALFASADSVVYWSTAAGTHALTLSNNTQSGSYGYELMAAGTSDVTWRVNNNQFTLSGSSPVTAGAQDSATVCMQLNNNTAYPTGNAYVLTNVGSGVFTLNPPQNNVGQLQETNITSGSCP